MARSYDPPEDVIDHTPDYQLPPMPPPMAPDDSARLRELRLKAASWRLSDAEKAEFGKLALAEAEAAGHPAQAEQKTAPVSPENTLVGDILTALEHIAAAVPAAHALAPRLAAMRAKLADMISPPAKK